MTICGFYLLMLLAVLGYQMSNGATTTTKSPQLQYRAPCAETTQCLTSDAVCNASNICACDDAHYYDMDTCTEKQVFGGVCSETSQCDTSDFNIECIQTTANKKCLCKTGWYRPITSCVQFNTFNLAFSDTSRTGLDNLGVTWTNDNVLGGYTVSYTVDWSPGSTGAVTTPQKTYNIPSLSAGTQYTVMVALHISLYGRSQQVETKNKIFTTKQAFGGSCNDTSPCDTASDSNIACVQTTAGKRCLCKNGWYKPSTSCVQFNTFNLAFSDTSRTGLDNLGVTWTNDNVLGGYTVSYTVDWSPGSTGAVTTPQKTYNIPSLSAGTQYTVMVALHISLYGRSQQVETKNKIFTTRGGYNETCTQQILCIDVNSLCYSGRCRCDQGFYRNTICTSIEQLRPTSEAADVHNTTAMTVSWEAPSNAIITGYEVSVTSGGITQISVDRYIRTTPITGLTPGRQYSVSVKTKITYLQGRDEMTDTVPAATKRTPPASIVALDSKTNRTAPDITIVFSKAEGDANKYIVTLSGRDGDTYYQRQEPLHGSGQDLISVVFTGVVTAVSYTLTIQTQSGNLVSSPYTTVIRAQAKPAGKVSDLKSFDNTSRSVAVEWRRPAGQPNWDIYEYIVDVKTGSACVKRVFINCIDCNRTSGNMTMSQMTMQCATNMTVVISPTDIENNDYLIRHNITGLNPDTPYSINVVAVNEEGPGATDQVNYHTPEEAAGEPTNLMAQSRSSSEITLTWDPPQPRPGVTQYNVTVYEQREDGVGYDTLKIIPISGDWRTKTYTIGYLLSYWFYKFDIVALTSIGASAIVSSSPERTMESEPTASTNLRITKLPNVFNMVRVSWKCPKQKNGRNGEIVNANLIFFTIQQAVYVEPVRKNINFSIGGTDCMWDETVTVTTEFMYEFQVRLYNRGFVGAVVNTSLYIQGGPPLQTEIDKSVRKGTEQSETPPLLICPRCLHDRTNSQVNKTGLIVCRKDYCGQTRNRRQTTSAVDYDNMANWNAANALDFGIPYRATRDNWLDGLIGKSSLLFTLGNEDCSGNTTNLFCNGKIPSGETFIVYAFSCTNYGCTTGNRIELSKSAPVPVAVPVAAVVGGVVAAVVVTIVVIGIFIFLRRKKAQRERPKKSRDQVIAKFHPDQSDTYDEIPDAQMVTVDSSRSNEGHVNYVSGQSSRDPDDTYDQPATYQNADGHDYGRITTETRIK